MVYEDQGIYEAPEIVYEGKLEIRAGSPVSVEQPEGIDLLLDLPGS